MFRSKTKPDLTDRAVQPLQSRLLEPKKTRLCYFVLNDVLIPVILAVRVKPISALARRPAFALRLRRG